MAKTILDNGIRILYKYKIGALTSFSIGFDGGAFKEDKTSIGVAHLLEHILFKGTKTKDEDYINRALDEIFVFNNAMTNYPYAIYYGTTLTEDFEKGFRLYSDILINPKFDTDGFCEEKYVVMQESKEWKEDLEQLLEDELLYNGYKNKRIKDIIIGEEKQLENISLEQIKEFYNKFYVANNCVISVVTSMEKEHVIKIIKNLWGEFRSNHDIDNKDNENLKEKINEGVYEKKLLGFEGGKVLYAFDIGELSPREIKILKVFNTYFGEGVSSRLYDEIRTKRGLSYDVGAKIKYEKNIGLYTLYASSQKNQVEKVKQVIDFLITTWKDDFLKVEDINTFIKRAKMKSEFINERSIELAKRLCTDEIMFKEDCSVDNIDVSKEKIVEVAEKVLRNPIIQIIK